MMTREQRERVNRLVETLLDVEPPRRAATLDALAANFGTDAIDIRREVERLLEEDEAVATRLAALAPESTPSTSGDVAPAPDAPRDSGRDRVPTVIGRYHLRGPLGDGGMGIVYLAEQRAPIARTVAIKLVKAGVDTHEVLARFDAERQALARMDHPNIARVYDAGVTDAGRPYFVMEYVPGAAITRFADDARLPLRPRVELFAQVCDAIAHAHTKGIIHRDLKPGNVLAHLGEDGTPRVKVIDFGIAKALASGERSGKTTHLTSPDLVLGTYEYMSPEQAAGSADLDTRSDVYSLGVLLYELLSGLLPFEREGRGRTADDELRRAIREVEPTRPSSRVLSMMRPATSAGRAAGPQAVDRSPDRVADVRGVDARTLARSLRRELEWIPMMALRKDRQRRYGSAAELAADVRNFLAGRPLVAAPESKRYLAGKFVNRHRRWIAVAATVLVLLVAGVVGTTIGLRRESVARRLADENGRRATQGAYRAAIAAADVALRSGDGVRLRWALDSAPPELRNWEWHWLARSAGTSAVRLRGNPGERFGHCGSMHDARHATATTVDRAQTVIWEVATGEVIRRLAGHTMLPDPVGKTYAIIRPDGALEVVDVATHAVRWRAERPSPTTAWTLVDGSFSRDGGQLVATDGSDVLTVVDVGAKTAKRWPTSRRVERLFGFLDFASDAAADSIAFLADRTIARLLLDPRTGSMSDAPRFDAVVARTPLIDTGRDQFRTLGITPHAFNMPHRAIWERLSVLPKRAILASAQEDGSVLLYAAEPSERVAGLASGPRQLIVGAAGIRGLAATADERSFVVALHDGSVLACPIDPPAEVSVPMRGVRDFALAPDGRRIVNVGWGDVLCVDALTGMPEWGRSLGPHDSRAVAWSPDGRLVVVASVPQPDPPATGGAGPTTGPSPAYSDVFVLDGDTGAQLIAWSRSPVTPERCVGDRPAWTRELTGVAFSADGNILFAAHGDAPPSRVDVATWRMLPGQPTTEPAEASATTGRYALERSPDGARLLVLTSRTPGEGGPRGSNVTVRDARTLKAQRRFESAGMSVTASAWAGGGRRIAVAFARSDDAFVAMFDVATGAERYRVHAPDGSQIVAIACTADGTRLVAMTRSRRVLVVNAETGDEVLATTLPLAVRDALFTPDGALLVTGEDRAVVRHESGDAEGEPAAIVARWPGSIAAPPRIDEARRQVRAAAAAVVRAYNEGLEIADVAASEAPAALVAEYARRAPPGVNAMNSAALSIMQRGNLSAADARRAEALLRRAVDLKPQSAFLQDNLGSLLFEVGSYDRCLEPLAAAERILASRGLPPAPTIALRLAIASKRCGRPDAETRYAIALAIVTPELRSGDRDVVRLLERGVEAFGH